MSLFLHNVVWRDALCWRGIPCHNIKRRPNFVTLFCKSHDFGLNLLKASVHSVLC